MGRVGDFFQFTRNDGTLLAEFADQLMPIFLVAEVEQVEVATDADGDADAAVEEAAVSDGLAFELDGDELLEMVAGGLLRFGFGGRGLWNIASHGRRRQGAEQSTQH